MEEPKLICNFQLGDLYQKVYIYDRGVPGKINPECYRVELANLPDFIAKTQDVHQIYLSGAPVSILLDISKKVEEKEKILYNNNIKSNFHFE